MAPFVGDVYIVPAAGDVALWPAGGAISLRGFREGTSENDRCNDLSLNDDDAVVLFLAASSSYTTCWDSTRARLA